MEVSRRVFVSGLALAACADRASPEGAPTGATTGTGATTPFSSLAVPSGSSVVPDAVRARAPLLQARFVRDVPFLPLAAPPTPLVEVEALGRAIGVGSLWIKRDDRASDLFGGSKVRKLEWLLGAARARGATTLVTFGGAGSNQAVATAAFGARAGFHVRVLLAPQPPSEVVRRNLRACVRFGATIEAIDGVTDAEKRELQRADTRTFVVPAGGSTPIGNLGFVEAALELDAQLRAGGMPPFDVIVIPLGTSGSAAGLAMGLGATGVATRILGVRASSDAYSSAPPVRTAVREIAAFLGTAAPSIATEGATARIDLDAGALGRGYGHTTASGAEASRLVQEHAGIELEPIYCAKAFAGLRAHAKDLASSRVLFWLTQPPWPGSAPGALDPDALPPRLRPLL